MKAKLLLLLTFFLVPVLVLAEEGGEDDNFTSFVSEQIVGDPNGDGGISAADAAVVLRASKSMVSLDSDTAICADINADLKVDSDDAVSILLYSAGMTDELSSRGKSYQDSLLENQFMDRFSYHGILRTNNDYRSESVSVTVTERRVGKSDVFIADILLRDISSFRTAFGKDTFNGGDRTDAMAKEKNAIIAINGDSCSQKNYPGPVIRNGETYIATFDKKNDVCVLYRDGRMLTFAAGTKAEDIFAVGEVFQAWGFGPTLLDEEGKAKETFTSSRSIASENPRTAIGYYEPGHYVFVVCDGRQKTSKGMTLADFSALFEELGCVSAYNLDGGQTSVMANSSRVINNPYHKGRSTTDILYISEPVPTELKRRNKI